MKDQYLKALDIFDSENSRFWTRFNLFTGFQLVLVAGFASNYEDIMKHKSIAILLLAVAVIFSVFTLIVTWRSRQISLGIFQTIRAIEKKDESLTLIDTYMKNTKSPTGVIAGYCVAMSVLLAVFWFIFLVMTIGT